MNPNGTSAETGDSCFHYYIPVSNSTTCTSGTCPEDGDVCKDLLSSTPIDYVLKYQPDCQYATNPTVISNCNATANVNTSRILVKCEAAPVSYSSFCKNFAWLTSCSGHHRAGSGYLRQLEADRRPQRLSRSFRSAAGNELKMPLRDDPCWKRPRHCLCLLLQAD